MNNMVDVDVSLMKKVKGRSMFRCLGIGAETQPDPDTVATTVPFSSTSIDAACIISGNGWEYALALEKSAS